MILPRFILKAQLTKSPTILFAVESLEINATTGTTLNRWIGIGIPHKK